MKRPHIEVWARDMETRLALSTVKRRISTAARRVARMILECV